MFSMTSWAAATIQNPPAANPISAAIATSKLDALADKVLIETDASKRDLLIKEAFEIVQKDYGYIPLHQQALAWGVSKNVKLTQRADNQVLLYWATKQE